MPSITLFHLLFALLFGTLLGLAYYALLWVTVKYLHRVRWPAIWVLFSLVLRLTGVVAGLYWVSFGSWLMLVTALAGILVVRIYFSRYLASTTEQQETGAANKH